MAKVVHLISVVVFVAFVTAGVQAQTHMGQQPSNHVTLQSVGHSGGCDEIDLDFVRVLPDGTGGSDVFRIPERQVFVVTDVDWQYAHPNGAAEAGTIQIFRLWIENLADPSISRRAFESTIKLNSVGEGGISEHMTSGFVVSSLAHICPDVFPGPDTGGGGIQHVIVRGYLMADR